MSDLLRLYGHKITDVFGVDNVRSKRHELHNKLRPKCCDKMYIHKVI